VHDYSSLAHEKQPHVITFYSAFPNRYLAESMTVLHSYALHQGWDAIIYDTWADDEWSDTLAIIGTTESYEVAKHPVFNAMMPALSQMFRKGLVAPATNTIRLQHTRKQIAHSPRFAYTMGRHALPGYIPNWAMAVNRIVQDSMNASAFTQSNDISFPAILDDEAMSDTRELRWEFNEGVLSVNTPRVQGATGHISRSSGVSLDKLDIDVLSGNETATVLWVAMDSLRTLDDDGRSFLVVTSRTEVSGSVWRDSADILSWGTGPMVVEPVRARLSFSFDDAVHLWITPLDSSGAATDKRFLIRGDSSIVIDQTQTKTQWYEVVVTRGAGVDETGDASLSSMSMVHTREGIQLQLRMDRGVSDATLDIYDAVGRHCATADVGSINEGRSRHNVDLDGLSSGSYTAVMRSPGRKPLTARMIVVR
ncbi:MAG: hypothetical protein H7X80_08315, partial [bacterium]|nr:hypothetical protein [Candidatus Kapabacteria bacterium]